MEHEEYEKTEQTEQPQTFTKAALLASGKWKRDLLNAVLEDDKSYTIAEVEGRVAPFMKKG